MKAKVTVISYVQHFEYFFLPYIFFLSLTYGDHLALCLVFFRCRYPFYGEYLQPQF
jgi:hypothetical protein